jgi:hypothetical protein
VPAKGISASFVPWNLHINNQRHANHASFQLKNKHSSQQLIHASNPEKSYEQHISQLSPPCKHQTKSICSPTTGASEL